MTYSVLKVPLNPNQPTNQPSCPVIPIFCFCVIFFRSIYRPDVVQDEQTIAATGLDCTGVLDCTELHMHCTALNWSVQFSSVYRTRSQF